MQAQKIELSTRNRSWFRKLFFPVALEQKFSFQETSKVNYTADVTTFIEEQLKPRAAWLKQHDPKGELNYSVLTNQEHRIGEIKLVIELSKSNLATLYKLRWG